MEQRDSGMHKKDILDLARSLYTYLKEHCLGCEQSTYELVHRVLDPDHLLGEDDELPLYLYTEGDMWDIHWALWRIVQQGRKYVMDFDCYANQSVGLPFGIPFIFRLRKSKHPFWEGNVPYFESGKDYLNWVKKCEEDMFESKEIWAYFQRLKGAILTYGYDVRIPDSVYEDALMRSQRSGEMIDKVPDPEFLPGGESEDQCDGWTYHLEFLLPDEYRERYSNE